MKNNPRYTFNGYGEFIIGNTYERVSPIRTFPPDTYPNVEPDARFLDERGLPMAEDFRFFTEVPQESPHD